MCKPPVACLPLVMLAAYFLLDHVVRPKEVALPKIVTEADYSFSDLEITLSDESLASLQTAPRDDVHGSIKIGNLPPTSIKLHLKGSASFQRIDKKPSFTIAFVKEGGGESWQFGRKFYLHNSLQDPSMLSDIFARRIYNHFNIPSGKLGFAWIKLNNKPLGAYTIAEGISREFLQKTFGETEDGVCLEGQQITPDEAISKGLTKFSKGSQHSKRDSMPLHQESLVNIVAADYLMANDDGFTFASNNYWLYCRPNGSSFEIFPHTADTAFLRIHSVLRDSPRTPEVKKLLGDTFGKALIKRKIVSNLDVVSSDVVNFGRIIHTRLVNDIAARAPNEANKYCIIGEEFLDIVKSHFASLGEAVLVDEGKIAFTRQFTNSASWRLRTGANSKVQRVNKARREFCLSSTKSVDQVICDAQFLINPGQYLVQCDVVAKNISPKGAPLLLSSGIVGQETKRVILSNGMHHLQTKFVVAPRVSHRLFDAEPCTLRLSFNSLRGIVVIKTSSVSVTPTLLEN
jgi:hypothetical protein